MTLEKIFKRDYGTQYLIRIDMYIDTYKEKIVWKVDCWCRDKGKRNWNSLPDTMYDFTFRKLSMEDRETHKNANILRFVTAEEILSVKLELWNNIKPTL